MNAYLIWFILVVLALFQSTVMPRITIMGIHPDLILMVVISWSLLRGAEEGMLLAVIGGVPLDLISEATFGIHTLALLFTAFVSGFGQRTVFRSEVLMPILAIPIATLVYELIILSGLFLTGWPVAWGTQITQVVLPCMAANTVCMPFVYLIVRVLHRRTQRERMTV